jgi:hypothetical protein
MSKGEQGILNGIAGVLLLIVSGIWLMASKNFLVGVVLLALGLTFLIMILSSMAHQYALTLVMAVFIGLCWLVIALVAVVRGDPRDAVVLVAYGVWYIAFGTVALVFIQRLFSHLWLLGIIILAHFCAATSGILAGTFPLGQISPWVIVSPALISIVLIILFVLFCATSQDPPAKQDNQPASVN